MRGCVDGAGGCGSVMASERELEHAFEERTDGVEPRVEVGGWVKVERCSERFWCKVRRVCADGTIVACVDNNLMHNPYRCGDELVLRNCHVLETADGRDSMAFRELATTLGLSGGAMAWVTAHEEAGV